MSLQKLISSLLIFSLSLNLFLVNLPADIKYPFKGKISADSVNVRAGYNANFKALCKFDEGDEVTVIEKKYSWYKILLPKNAKAYIHADFIEESDGKAVITGNNVNVRSRPDLKSSIIGQMNKGDLVELKDKFDGWFCVVPNSNCFGWVKEEYIAFSGDLSPEEIARINRAEQKEEILAETKPLSQGVKEPLLDNVELEGTLKAPWGRLKEEYPYKLITSSEIYYLKFKNSGITSEYHNQKATVIGKIVGKFKSYPVVLADGLLISQ